MVGKKLTVHNQTGLHARPASELTKLCQKYQSNITIQFGDETINPKSILSLLSGGIVMGSGIYLEVEGSDEEEALEAITNLIDHFIE